MTNVVAIVCSHQRQEPGCCRDSDVKIHKSISAPESSSFGLQFPVYKQMEAGTAARRLTKVSGPSIQMHNARKSCGAHGVQIKRDRSVGVQRQNRMTVFGEVNTAQFCGKL